MSKRLKEKIGEELYNKILESGLKESDFDLTDGYVPRQRLNEVSEKLKATEGKVTEYEKQVTETKKLLETNEDFKARFADLETKFKDTLKAKDIEIGNVLKKSLVKEKLIESGARHTNLLMKEIDLDNIKIENDKLFGFDEQLSSIKDAYKDLFVEKVNKQEGQAGVGTTGNTSNDDYSWMDNIK